LPEGWTWDVVEDIIANAPPSQRYTKKLS